MSIIPSVLCPPIFLFYKAISLFLLGKALFLYLFVLCLLSPYLPAYCLERDAASRALVWACDGASASPPSAPSSPNALPAPQPTMRATRSNTWPPRYTRRLLRHSGLDRSMPNSARRRSKGKEEEARCIRGQIHGSKCAWQGAHGIYFVCLKKKQRL